MADSSNDEHWIDPAWLLSSDTDLVMVMISGVGIYVVLMLLTRLAGLRSFSKMSSFDFALTVACGSIIASTLLNKQPALMIGVFGLTVVYAMRYALSKLRHRFDWVGRLVDNQPLLLMRRSTVLHGNLKKSRVTEQDLKQFLRLAGIRDREQVLAVVLETTGDVSVIKVGDTVDDTLDDWLFDNVRDA